ncbi:MAG: GMC family oxidoreductase [Sandaracinaceae bacterium]|nr:GMC family oxidoreductase [Sandaracinaceae bacterium]
MDAFDYVVVGGGSAGCVAAAELSEDPRARVLLLEMGARAEDHPETLRADGYKDAFANDALVAERFSVVDPRWGDRRLFMGSGRGIGGSGAINAMVYTRGSALDYDEWPRGWRWPDVTPDFAAIEARLRPRPRPPTEFTEACLDAAQAAGFRRSDALNDGDLGGVLGYEPMNYEENDRRNSYVGFLRPAMARDNLVVVTGARVHRLVLGERGVTAVRFEEGGALREVAVRREVLMCAGALETPRVLMLSGIGASERLRRAGLPALVEAPRVGENLHDHPNVCVFFRGGREVDCAHPQLYGFHRANTESALPPGMSDTCYVFYPARSSLREAMIRILPGLVLPEPLYETGTLPKMIRSGVGLAFRSAQLREQVKRVYGIVVILGKPKSRGRIELATDDPRAPARIDPGYFAEPDDLDTMVAGVARARRIAAAPALSAWGNRELFPGPLGKDRPALERWIKQNVMTTYHYAGTCAMGEDRESVADARLAVRGVPGLRVADASAIPVTPVSALNAPSMLVGYRAARFAREAHAS